MDTLYPDYNRLQDYYPLTQDQIANFGDRGVEITSEHYNIEYYQGLADRFVKIAEDNGIGEHFNELMFIMIVFNDRLVEFIDGMWENYNDELKSKELAAFLLAYKTALPNHDFQLTAKPVTGSVTIKSQSMAHWMCSLIYDAIEQRKAPFDVFGYKLNYDIFGEDFKTDKPIDVERLKKAANLKPKNPKTLLKGFYCQFYYHLKPYLIKYTNLTSSTDVFITDAQANFFFNVLELFNYVDRDSITSEPKDYINTMLRNNLK
ncbi:hypothetical protein [Pedobacter sp. Leaf250]|uniref:hypothetical protein n=1 Tax=Pedobacter sp. Leaf250 TaxID=2876559 RepID=UPI001E515D51|nr:hypothetical protein [Pedobacter sp. Leaf250]